MNQVKSWPKNPIIYEINTCPWLYDLSQRYKRRVTLSTVPLEEWEAIAALGFDAVWLMGVWERSPAGIKVAREHKGLQDEYERALADFSKNDVVGSPYSIHKYVVDRHLGGPDDLAGARKALAYHDIRLVLDFVPNHIAIDHPWVIKHPEYLIQGNSDDLSKAPDEFFEAGGHILAHGRDPYFPPWTDTAQINSFHEGLRKAAIETLLGIAEQCDGVRCDMAMLMVNSIFQNTWGQRTGDSLDLEYWQEIIDAVKTVHPNFIFMAEVYWDMEWDLQQQGFDYCYDKRLYDRLVHKNANTVQKHLDADLTYQEKLIRFIENHDEPRAAAAFNPQKLRASALTFATLTGAKLFHEGQLEGRKIRLPVQLGRRHLEKPDMELKDFYTTLFKAINNTAFRDGDWHICEISGWPDNNSYINIVSWCWREGDHRWLIVVNLSNIDVQGRVHIPWNDISGQEWLLKDIFSKEEYKRNGKEIHDKGLFVNLKEWGFHLFKFQRN